MSEMAVTAEHLIVIGRGRLIADAPTAEFIQRASRNSVLVRSLQLSQLREALVGPEVTVTSHGDGALQVTGLRIEEIGQAAADRQIVLHELSPQSASLEEAFMELTQDSVEYHATTTLTDTKVAS
jgi:ABC-2 type transport system ATP-binding protein